MGFRRLGISGSGGGSPSEEEGGCLWVFCRLSAFFRETHGDQSEWELKGRFVFSISSERWSVVQNGSKECRGGVFFFFFFFSDDIFPLVDSSITFWAHVNCVIFEGGALFVP